MPDQEGGQTGNIITLKEKKKRASPNVVIEKKIFTSKAWLSLTGIAAQVLPLFLLKRQLAKTGKRGHEKWVCTNSQEIVFTYAEAKEKYGITQWRFQRAIDDLIDKGFLDIAKSAGGLFKETTLYALSDRWRVYGTPDFKETHRTKRNHTTGYCKSKSKSRKKQAQDI